MKNNKGYTLVELLVTLAVFAIIMAEVGSMMMNSSKLYRNGTYEVELQTEAQQIVQQMEELLIDVNDSVSVNYQPTLSSDFITVSNNDGNGNETVYYFTLDRDPELGYGTLYFNKSETGQTPITDVPMAEYVQSITLDMDMYTVNDVVTLNVSMNNGKYGYQASQDIYLRNAVGTGGSHNYGNSSSYDFDVDILRLRNYDLNDYVGDSSMTYEFKWSDTNEHDPTVCYVLNSDGRIRVSDGKKYTSTEIEPFIIDVFQAGTTDKKYTIRVSSKAVEVGVLGNAVFMTHSDSLGGSYLNNTPIPVQGVAVEAAEVTVTLRYQRDPLISEPDEIYSTVMGTSDTESSVASSGEMKYNNDTNYLVQIQNFQFVKEPSSNCFQIRNQLISGGGPVVQHYYNYILTTNKTIYFEIEFDWGGGLTDDCIAHMYVVPANEGERMPEGPGSVFEKFWNIVGL